MSTNIQILAKNKVLEIAENISATNQDTVIANVEYIADTVIYALQSIIGSQSHMWSENESEQIGLWIEVKKQSKNIYK